jgi:hypothetical protein
MSGRRVSLRRSRERETRRVFGNGRRTLAATPGPKRETRFDPPVGGRSPCPLLEGVAGNVALTPISACSRIWRCRFRRACAVKRVAEAVSGILPREDKAIAIRVLSLSEPSASRSGPAVSTLMRKVPGLMLPSGPPMAALTNGGPLAETRRCISPHVFAAVMARSRRLLSAVRPWRCRWRPTRIARKTLEPRPARGRRSAYAPRGGGAKDLRPDLERRARP